MNHDSHHRRQARKTQLRREPTSKTGTLECVVSGGLVELIAHDLGVAIRMDAATARALAFALWQEARRVEVFGRKGEDCGGK